MCSAPTISGLHEQRLAGADRLFPSINRNIQDYAPDPRIAQTDKARNEISAGGSNTRFNATASTVSIPDAFGPSPNPAADAQAADPDGRHRRHQRLGGNHDVTIGWRHRRGGINAVDQVRHQRVPRFGSYGTYRENDWSGKNQNDVRPDIFDTDETYGGTFGGPPIEDKLFFFANYEKSTFWRVGTNFGPARVTNIVNITQADIDQIIGIASGYGFDVGTLCWPVAGHHQREYAIKPDWNINEQHLRQLPTAAPEQSQANTPGLATTLPLSSYLYQRTPIPPPPSCSVDWTDNFDRVRWSTVIIRQVRVPRRRTCRRSPCAWARHPESIIENTHANVLETQT